jgi:hypothetical protein
MTYPFGPSPEARAAGNVIPAACSSADGSASSPASRGCGPRARDTSRDGLSTAIMRPGQAIDASPGGPPVRRQQPERSGTSRRIAVGDPRTAVTAAISPQQPPELRLLLRRAPTEAAVRSRPQPARGVAGGSWKQVSWLIDDLVSGYRAVNALAVPISSERVRRSMLWVPRGAWPLVVYKSGSPLPSRPGVISKRRRGWPARVP